MSDQPDPVKQNIIDWCNEDGISFVDKSDDFPACDWIIIIDNTKMIYKQTRFPNRIYFQALIAISNEHQQAVQNPQTRTKIIVEIPTNVLQMGATCNIVENNGVINNLSITKVHFHSTIKKADFLENYIRLHNIHHTMLNQVSNILQTTAQQLQQNQPAPAPDASTVGIT